MAYLWVAIGGALGSMGRFWLSGVVAARFGDSFPLGTLLINVSGSFLMGVIAGLTEPNGKTPVPQSLKVFLMVGICGGYTTFSAFSLQTLNLMRNREWFLAGGNVMLSVLLCLIAVWLGYLLGLAIKAGRGN